MNDKLPLPLGTKVRPWGEIGAISYRDGERYYMFVKNGNDVALMPAAVVEVQALCGGSDNSGGTEHG
jgi:hypothetical protein